MKTPICDFVSRYAGENPLRLHMPGHKGQGPLGVEAMDITEVEGADVLYHAQGIIRQSEDLAGSLFGSGRTVYSTEGSSVCIRAMVYLARMHAQRQGKPCRIAAGRNAHKVFLSAVALLDVEVSWIYPQTGESLLSVRVTPEDLDGFLRQSPECTAVYITSPDYLGGMADIAGLSRVCKAHGVLLMVDNAHGAYLRFLPESRHPLDLGADLCCDSAHKTLPVLTGGAYLHIAATAPMLLKEQAPRAMAMFASTSPSYLILQSLDRVNALLCGAYGRQLQGWQHRIRELRDRLTEKGWGLYGNEPLKITICAKERGYTGQMLAQILRKHGIECEFADPDYLVLMFSPSLPEDAVPRLEAALDAIVPAPPIGDKPPAFSRPQVACSPREAMLDPGEEVAVADALGRVLCDASVSCPPAIPVAVCGERLDENAIARMHYYGVTHCRVMTE